MSDAVTVPGRRTGRTSAAGAIVAGVIAAIGFVLPSGVMAAGPAARFERLPGRLVEVRAGDGAARTAPVLERSDVAGGSSIAGVATADIQVDYNGFSAQARTAFQKAVRIWERRIVSSRPIHVKANWKDLGFGILGMAGPKEFYIHNDDHVYPVALTEAICECEPFGSHPVEIVANFNSAFGSWYLGTDGHPPANRYDFVTVVLHELAHGLGFLSSFGVSGGLGYWGFTDGAKDYPLWYDEFVYGGPGPAATPLMDTTAYPNPSNALKAQLTDGSVFFGGPEVVAVLGGRAELYAPKPWDSGSSNSHFDEDAFPTGTQNALMTPILHNGEVIHAPGALTLALFRDIGWDTANADGTPPTVGEPRIDLRSGVSASNSTTPVPARASFSASDPSGIASTDLDRRLGDDPWVDVPHSPADDTSIDVFLPAHDSLDQRLRAAATDGAGNESRFTPGDPFRVLVSQDGDGDVVQSGDWTTSTKPGFFGGSVRHTSTSGGGHALTVADATDLAVVSTIGPDRGKAKIYIDGAFHSGVNLYSAAAAKRRVVFSIDFGTPGDHTIEFRSTGTKAPASRGTRADFDAFLAVTEP